ncbi:hypothetical protein XELAEV_18032915mg [Xenopus laevis]|uniref:Uncharacterized protein n=1 Tax=Xenopus laevis TaxID=8355 RepID=A0A974HDH5_XENLA|nr:hypothetical protein XELAEV_18032915mg [Xenopus laevis]
MEYSDVSPLKCSIINAAVFYRNWNPLYHYTIGVFMAYIITWLPSSIAVCGFELGLHILIIAEGLILPI